MFLSLQFNKTQVDTSEQSLKQFKEFTFQNVLSCTQYNIEVNLMWETGNAIIFDTASNPIPSLNKSFTTQPDINKEVEIAVIENGTDFISFQITGILSSK